MPGKMKLHNRSFQLVTLTFVCLFIIVCWPLLLPDWDRELYDAAATGSLARARGALSKGADINFRNPDEKWGTPLLAAVRDENDIMVQLLLKSGADPSIENRHGMTPLGLASKSLNTQIVQLLIAFGADVNQQNTFGQTALFWAAEGSDSANIKLVQYLLRAGANIRLHDLKNETAWNWAMNKKHKLSWDKSRTKQELLLELKNITRIIRLIEYKPEQRLAKHASAGNLAGVKRSLKQGAYINARDEWGDTPLINAAEKGRQKVILYLLKQSAFVDAQSEYQTTALYHATLKGHMVCVKTLLKAGASMYAGEYSPLFTAATYRAPNSLKILLYFIQSEADLNWTNKRGYTLLMSTTTSKRLKSIKILLKAGAKVDQRRKNGKTALMYAAEHNNIEAAKLFLTKGADANAFMNNPNEYEYQKTVLMFAAGSYYDPSPELLKLLLKHGANPTHKDKQGLTALDHARQRGHADIIKLLTNSTKPTP